MRAERERLARQKRAEGEEEARRIRAEAEREARVTVAEARRDAEILRGEGDAEAAGIYAEAYGQDPDFFYFVRRLEAYRKTIGEGTTLVLPPSHEFFRLFESSEFPERGGPAAGVSAGDAGEAPGPERPE
jgi:membrane protease subunit HflC